MAGGVDAGDARRTEPRVHEPGQHAEEGRLARAVRPEQGMDLAALDRQRRLPRSACLVPKDVNVEDLDESATTVRRRRWEREKGR